MNTRLLVLVILLGLGRSLFISKSVAQQPEVSTPVVVYLNDLRRGAIDPRLARFADTCPAKPTDVQSHFAFSNDDAGTWKVVQSLPSAYDNLEMDLVGMAQVWKTQNGVLIEFWNVALDVGGFQRTFDCFDSSGRLVSEDSTNYQIPEDGPTWGMHERWHRQSNGRWTAIVPFEFVGLDDRAMSEPKLDPDSRAFVSSWGKKPPGDVKIDDLRIPPSLLH